MQHNAKECSLYLKTYLATHLCLILILICQKCLEPFKGLHDTRNLVSTTELIHQYVWQCSDDDSGLRHPTAVDSW